MTEALLALPAHLRKRLAHALDSGTVAPPYGAVAVGAAIGGASESDAVARALTDLHGLGVSGRGCAAWLRGLDQLVSWRGRRISSGPGRKSPACTRATRAASTRNCSDRRCNRRG